MNKLINIFRGVLFGLVIFLVASCKRENTALNLKLDQSGNTIMFYLNGDPNYSILSQALEITKLSAGLKIYGTKTLFAPTDSAFQKYFKRKGISNISEVNPDTLLNLLEYHIYNEVYTSAFFSQGTLATPTVSGNFIKFDISKGLKNTVLNDIAKVQVLDVLASNGVVHAIDDVLEPSPLTIYDWLKTQPDYSIMLEAFEKTGNAESLLKRVEFDPNNVIYGKPAMKWLTVFLETNAVLKQSNIESFEDLASKFSQNYNTTKNYTDPSDSLNLFVRYHVLDRKYFISDFSDTYIESASTDNFLVFNTTGGLSVNKHIVVTLNGPDTIKTEVKSGLDLDRSNTITKNGIVNSLTSLIQLYKVEAVTVQVRFAGEVSERAIKLKDGTVSTFIAQFPILGNDPAAQQIIPWLKWNTTAADKPTVTANSGYFGGDYVVTFPNVIAGYWYELTTKLVFKGNYDLYVNYSGKRRSSVVTNATFAWDGAQVGDITNLADPKDAFGNTVGGGDDQIYRRKLGTLNLAASSTHVFRVDGIANDITSWFSIELVPVKN